MAVIVGGAGLAGLGWLAVAAARKTLGPALVPARGGARAEAADPGAGGNVRLLPASGPAEDERAAEPAGIA